MNYRLFRYYFSFFYISYYIFYFFEFVLLYIKNIDIMIIILNGSRFKGMVWRLRKYSFYKVVNIVILVLFLYFFRIIYGR